MTTKQRSTTAAPKADQQAAPAPAPETPPAAPVVATTGETRTIAKDAETGKIVSEADAAARPSETYHQTIEETVELSQAVNDVLDVDLSSEGSVGTLANLGATHAVRHEYNARGEAQLSRQALVVAAARLIKAVELLDEAAKTEGDA